MQIRPAYALSQVTGIFHLTVKADELAREATAELQTLHNDYDIPIATYLLTYVAIPTRLSVFGLP